MTPEAIIAIATPIAVIVAAVLQRLDARKSGEKLEDIAKTSESVHILVNSSMSAALRTSAVSLRHNADLLTAVSKLPPETLAQLPPHMATSLPSAIKAADEAEKLYNIHEAKQRVVDAKHGEPSDL